MSRPAGKIIPSLRRHKASNRAYVVLSGKPICLGKWNSQESKAKYDKVIGEWLASGRNLPAPSDGYDLTVVELIARFSDYSKIHYRRNGKATKTVERFEPILGILRRLYGSTLVSEFGPLALRAIRERLIKSNLSRQTINDDTRRIRTVFKYGVSVGIVPSYVLDALRAVPSLEKGRSEARETGPVRPVSDTDIEKTLKHLPPTITAMVQVQRLTGTRPAEVVQMRPIDIDRSGEVWVYIPEHHKTEHHGKQRVIPIGPKAQAILTPYLDRDETAYCFDPRESEALRLLDRHRNRETPISCGNKPGSNRVKKPKKKPGTMLFNFQLSPSNPSGLRQSRDRPMEPKPTTPYSGHRSPETFWY